MISPTSNINGKAMKQNDKPIGDEPSEETEESIIEHFMKRLTYCDDKGYRERVLRIGRLALKGLRCKCQKK